MRRGRRRDGLCQALPGLKGVVLRMAPYWRPHGGLIGAGSAALIAAVLARLLEPWPLKFVIDHIVPVGGAAESAPAATGLPFLGDLPLTGFLLACALGLVSVIGMRAMFEYLATVAFALAGNRILTAVRGDLFRHLQRLPLAFHSRQRAGDLVVRLIGDVGMMKETVVTAAMPLAVNGLVLLGMAMVMFWLDWRLALLALSPLPLLWLGTLRQGTKIRNVSREQRQTEGRLAAAASESLVGIRTVQALGLEDEISGGFANANGKSLAQGVRAKRLAAALERFVDLLVAIATALVLYFGTLFVIDGKLTPGDLLIFITYLKNTFRPVRDYAKFSARLAKATAAGERVVELLDTPLEIRDQADAEPARIERGRIRFKHVEFTHPGQQTTLRGIDLAIEPGEKIAVTGPSGSGKSTLISLLLRLYDPDAGSIVIDGQDLRKVTLASLRRQIAFVPQETLLVNASMRDNLLLGVGRPVDQAELETAARLANAHEFIERLPKGYDTIQAERGASLSAGQRQRLAIARAALRQSPVLVLDEPTVGLDSNNDALVTEAIWRIARGRTTILVTHDLALAARADRIVYLAEGLITESGSHAELVRAGGLYADVWRQQRVCADARAA